MQRFINYILSSLLLLYIFSPNNAKAQYYKVTAFTTSTTTQTIGGVTVTITSTGGNFSSPYSYCSNNPGPYLLGNSSSGSYTFSFSQPVGKIRIRMHGMQNGEVVSVKVNGAPYPLTAANNLTQCTGCSGPCQDPVASIVGGDIHANSSGTSGGQFIVSSTCSSGGISSIKLIHGIPAAAGVGISLEFDPNVGGGGSGGPTVNISGNTSFCAGSSTVLTANASGGSAPYTYNWTPGGTNSTQTVTSGGTYKVEVTDKNGCTASDNINVTVNPKPNVNAGADVSICKGQSTTLTATGANSYNWDNGLGSGATQSVSPTSTTTYTVTGTDGNSCTNTDKVKVTVTDKVTPSFTNPGPICMGASLTLPTSSNNGINGTWSPAVDNSVTTTYTFTPNSGECATTTTMKVVVNNQTTPTFNNPGPICEGESFTLPTTSNNSIDGTWSPSVDNSMTTTYTFTPNSGECATTTTMKVVVDPLPTIDAGTDQTVCGGTSITLSGSGAGTGGTYSWDNGVTDGVGFAQSVGTTTYTVTGTDANGCSNTDQVNVTVLPTPTYTVVIDSAVCNNGNGEFHITATNGSTPYTYTIDDGSNTPQSNTTGDFTGLSAGTYTITITDYNGCTTSGVEKIFQAGSPSIDNIVPINPSCYGVCDGQATVQVSGGATPYTYDWVDINNANIGNTKHVTNLCDGKYTVMITDNNGCKVNGTVTLTEPTPVDASFKLTDFCFQNANMATNITTTGGIFSFDPPVNDGATIDPSTGEISNATGGTTYTVKYTVSVNGCSASSTEDVLANAKAEPQFIADTLIGCNSLNVHFANNTPSNVNKAKCEWNFGDGMTTDNCGDTVTHHYDTPGTYTVSLKVTSTGGCVGTITQNNYITITAPPIASFSANPNKISFLQPEVQFTNDSKNAMGYTWDFGDSSALSSITDPVHKYKTEGKNQYIVTLIARSKDGKCNDTMNMVLLIDNNTIYYIPNTFTPDNNPFNPTFKPIFTAGFDPQDYTLRIFNRWGEILFVSHNTKVGWNGTYGGKVMQEGVYVWKISFKEATTDKHHTVVGNVNLLR